MRDYNVGDKVFIKVGIFNSIKQAEIIKIKETSKLVPLGPTVEVRRHREYLIKFESGKLKIVTEENLF